MPTHFLRHKIISRYHESRGSGHLQGISVHRLEPMEEDRMITRGAKTTEDINEEAKKMIDHL